MVLLCLNFKFGFLVFFFDELFQFFWAVFYFWFSFARAVFCLGDFLWGVGMDLMNLWSCLHFISYELSSLFSRSSLSETLNYLVFDSESDDTWILFGWNEIEYYFFSTDWLAEMSSSSSLIVSYWLFLCCMKLASLITSTIESSFVCFFQIDSIIIQQISLRFSLKI